MSGFFSSIVGKDQEQEYTTDNLFLFKNDEIYNKGFELWQHNYHHQQQKHHHQLQDLDFSVGSSKKIISTDHRRNNICDDSLYRSSSFRVMMMRQGGIAGGVMNCQDCGNQAKKGCAHMRCRTCCKNRGFQCQTHVKSTWVPAAKRRERLLLTTLQQQQQEEEEERNQQQQEELSLRGENNKRQRENSGLQVGHFPAEVNSEAVFRCIRVSTMDDAVEQYAYHTSVNVGGHVFKGILYDQGPESGYTGGENSFVGGGASQPLNLIAANAAAATTSNPDLTMLDPSIYSAPLSAFMAGMQFFTPPRS